ncbi:hypothetical protein [Streptomyces sp. TRM49041]|uniref:hypothetical protein n=1 Tax=Streptomyces sp. TRM49041 TaxID=2603216 RepID=UPI0011ECDC86|nr:hypothetical protein [Streptomyces sp. TRM49041]
MGSRSDELVLKLGAEILTDKKYADDRWQGIALVGQVTGGTESMNGYVYFADGDFEARTPATMDVLCTIGMLHGEMKKEGKGAWHQCLIHITRPDLRIRIRFEYDDPKRWSPKKLSRDMSEYADSLKPES